MVYQLSDQERKSGRIDPDKLASLVRDIREVGYAVLQDIVSEETCALLAESVLEDADRVRALGVKTRHEENTAEGHLQLGLRRTAPYVREDFVANPFIEAVVVGVLGPQPWLGFYNGNVNCPGSGYQPLHFDRPYSWKTAEDAARDGQSWPPHTTTLSCSVALEEITEANGATEIYPGSQFETDVVNWPTSRVGDRTHLLEKWSPPARMAIPARSVCFRDPRMWHRGVPNPASRPRAMIALTYVQDLDPKIIEACKRDPSLKLMDDGELGDGRLVFEENVREVFERAPNPHGVNRNVRFVARPDRVNHFHDSHNLGGARIVQGEVAPQVA
jgi:ectoine hydroxylase-related dioxygenase (phytanoyl-CoA dioxygenase family)